jgi:hypothetical protein
MTKEIVAGILGLASVAGGGFGAHEWLESRYAKQDAVLVAGAQASYVLDRQMQALLRDINRLEEKRNKTRDDRDTLKYLRETLKEMQEVRKGQKK